MSTELRKDLIGMSLGKKLTEWLAANKQRITEEHLMVNEAREEASIALGHNFSNGHISHRMGPGKVVEHNWPGTDRMLKSRASRNSGEAERRRLNLSIQMIERMRNELGIEPIDGWSEMVGELSKCLSS